MGTLSGGWRIVRTMELRIAHLKPVGLLRGDSGAATLFLGDESGRAGVGGPHDHRPIVWVGSVTSPSAVRWGVAGRIVCGRVLTIPCSALIAALTWAVVAPRNVAAAPLGARHARRDARGVVRQLR
ncbi:MAG: hypothetical protein AB7N53_18215 [Candidatus Binatia bacterium]